MHRTLVLLARHKFAHYVGSTSFFPETLVISDTKDMGNEFIPPQYLEPHYSTKLWRGYYFYLKRFYSEKLFEEICESLNMPLGYVLGDDNWVSNSFLSAFLEELK